MESGSWVVHGVRVAAACAADAAEYDATVLVTGAGAAPPGALAAAARDAEALDAALRRDAGLVRCGAAAGARLVLAPLGELDEFDDVRSAGEAAARGVRRALAAGARRPLLVLPRVERWPAAPLVALLAALEALYVPLQERELFPSEEGARALGVFAEGLHLERLLQDAVALETARGAARDIGGADPERMAAPAAARYVQDLFSAAPRVAVRVEDDFERISKEYPLLAAVARAAQPVERHRVRVVFLEYTPDEYEETVMLVGKGVTYDTGGADIKTGGAMFGMSRDKCGAATVVGFIKACELLRARVKAVGALALVRNSVGAEAYVADELLVSRRGAGVHVGNTDAEGRLAMADLLAELAERAGAERAPHLYTVATLTGHAARSLGPYTAALGPAAAALRAAGDALGDPVEESRVRREDLAAHRAGAALLQARPGPSTGVARGHQGPAAFLRLAAGLAGPGAPRYTHLDVAGSAGLAPAPPTAAPLLALAALHKLFDPDYARAGCPRASPHNIIPSTIK